MGLHKRRTECHGGYIDQDGGEVWHYHMDDGYYCRDCQSFMCETHYNFEKTLCYSCADDDIPGSWDLRL